jgi:hypothetical protein
MFYRILEEEVYAFETICYSFLRSPQAEVRQLGIDNSVQISNLWIQGVLTGNLYLELCARFLPD